MQRILLSFVGNRDPYPSGDPSDQELGPVLSLLQAREFSQVVLYCTGSSYVERARTVRDAALVSAPGMRFNYVSIDLESPIDYEEIFARVKSTTDQFLSTVSHAPYEIAVLLDPGTPQMQTAWFLLVAGGHLDAELLQGVPPRFAGGAYKVRTVNIKEGMFPGVRIGPSTRDVPPSDSREQAPDTWIQSAEPPLIGSSPLFESVIEQASRVSRYDVSVLIRGETGTGKEVVARLVHRSSPRAAKPFVAINCAAITPSLAESELFGHEKGAFTGADRSRLGQFRAADGGTVFLDEVGDLPLEVQAKLLRVLEDQTLTPVGADSFLTVDVRIIAATNRNLEEQIAEGTFRRDLYERLAQVTITMPALRERPEDIPLLLRHFVNRWNDQYGEQKGIGDEAMGLLLDYPWPGNVRELQNAVTAVCAMGQSSRIGPELLPQAIRRHFAGDRSSLPSMIDIPDEGLDLRALLYDTERTFYEKALERTGGNAQQAARLLGVQGPAFRKAAKERLGIEWRESDS